MSKKIINSSTHYLQGSNSRGSELRFSFKVLCQLFRGFRKLHFVGPCITVFGSARFGEDHKYYTIARQIGMSISKLGFTTMTGGGPGIMEAANRGAYENDGKSVGCTIHLPKEQMRNNYMHTYVHFDYFFIRKFLLQKYSYAFIVMPGGFGTLDELFEVVMLIQTKIINNFPVVVYGTEYFSDVKKMIDKMFESDTISQEDKKLLLYTDDIDEAIKHVEEYISIHYLVKSKVNNPNWWLGEKRVKTEVQ